MSKDNIFLFFIYVVLSFLILPTTGLVSFVLFIPIFLLSRLFKRYGKFLSYTDVWFDEDSNNNLSSNLVITMALQGDLSLNELTNQFQNNVLEARSTDNFGKLRYPELKQFLTTFVCFRVWKNDPNFLIENHIKELSIQESLDGDSVLENLHQIYLTKPYQKNRSPWEMVLIRNVNLKSDQDHISCDFKQKSLLVFRVHHTMADAKSLLKLLVECLGKKQLKTAVTEIIKKGSTWNSLKFFVKFPIELIFEKITFLNLIFGSYHHPWRNQFNFGKRCNQNLKLTVSFSPDIQMDDIKMVAKENNVKSSAVVLSIIAGSIRKNCGDKWDKKVMITYPLAKPFHPEFLTNHVSMTTSGLATDQQCGIKRLQMCNKEFIQLKVKQQAKYLNLNKIMGGIQMYPISRFATCLPAPINITNNAGDQDGFSIGSAECIDFRMSVGTLHGLIGVGFCTISYKDTLSIAVIANQTILEKDTVDKLAKQIGLEFQLLMNSP